MEKLMDSIQDLGLTTINIMLSLAERELQTLTLLISNHKKLILIRNKMFCCVIGM